MGLLGCTHHLCMVWVSNLSEKAVDNLLGCLKFHRGELWVSNLVEIRQLALTQMINNCCANSRATLTKIRHFSILQRRDQVLYVPGLDHGARLIVPGVHAYAKRRSTMISQF